MSKAVYWASQSALVIKNPPANADIYKGWGFDSWVMKIPRRRTQQLTPILLLQNPMDREAWQAAVHRVTQSQTRLKQLGSSSHIYRMNCIWLGEGAG